LRYKKIQIQIQIQIQIKNPIYHRDLIRKDNNGKIGVYAWINNINGKFYIGSEAEILYSKIKWLLSKLIS